MPKLFQINTYIKFTSTGHIAEEIGQSAIANGWESYIAYGRNKRQSQSKIIKIGNPISIYSHLLMTRLFDRHGLASTKATLKLIKQIQDIKPDIIHLHNIHGYYLNYKILFNYLKKSAIPVVWTLHDCWSFTGHCTHFSYIQCEKWKTLCKQCVQKNAYPSSFLLDRSKINYLTKKESFLLDKGLLILVPVSDWLANLCSQSFFKNIPIKRIHNGINTAVFKPVSEKEKQEIIKKYGVETHFLLGIASVWTKRKGFDDFMNLASIIPDNYRIMLVGLSKKQLKKLPKNIIGIKRTENMNELVAIYSIADVFVNPTWEDNFPTTNLEAMACGTPVITYKTGGSIEAITPETGYIIEQGDITGLLNAINNVIKKGKNAYSTICREHILKNFKKEDRYMEYFQLYETLVKNKENV